jgi:hypothetical protein
MEEEPLCFERLVGSVGLIIRLMSVVEHFWYICILAKRNSGLSYERYIANRHKSKLLTYIQEPLVTGRRGYLQRDLKEKTVSSR